MKCLKLQSLYIVLNYVKYGLGLAITPNDKYSRKLLLFWGEIVKLNTTSVTFKCFGGQWLNE